MRLWTTCCATLLLFTAGCGDDKKCDPAAQTGCASGLACEQVEGGAPACFDPVVVSGKVFDLASPVAGLDGARVVALDVNRAPASAVAVSESGGRYSVRIPRQRKADGTPVAAQVTMRVDRAGYQSFPGGIRQALPLDLASATHASGAWTVQSALTDLGLLALPAGAGTSSIHGSVGLPAHGTGVLVVAEPAGGGAGVTGIADESGNYAVFNLAPGTAYVVTAYAKGVNFVPVTTAALAAGDNAVAQLALGSGAGAAFSGDLIFNNSASPNIQVTLVPQSTYVASLDRGETPPGLTVAADPGGSYAFSGVPDGTYRVLAAFGQDGDVRDVSGTGNTASPVVTIQAGAPTTTPPGFKIIPAVDLLAIGGTAVSATPAVVTTAAPVFTWQKGSVDSSAATYRVLVFDAFGNQAWSHDVAATQSESLTYAGAALQPGMTYQLRILAVKEAMPVPATFTQLSQTEDVEGVFTYLP